ncbi:oxidoreductase [Pseudomonas syringae pv. spinaceae]|uniref:Oxidoreductase n=1 Tax=Pseudomonas syringae pv. spinaceae TaxID=264459 RepID=A0A0Q0CPZ3_PSESX|nr:oxidoreductase [Pseudomonas syringae pv. spinaceae]
MLAQVFDGFCRAQAIVYIGRDQVDCSDLLITSRARIYRQLGAHIHNRLKRLHLLLTGQSTQPYVIHNLIRIGPLFCPQPRVYPRAENIRAKQPARGCRQASVGTFLKTGRIEQQVIERHQQQRQCRPRQPQPAASERKCRDRQQSSAHAVVKRQPEPFGMSRQARRQQWATALIRPQPDTEPAGQCACGQVNEVVLPSG